MVRKPQKLFPFVRVNLLLTRFDTGMGMIFFLRAVLFSLLLLAAGCRKSQDLPEVADGFRLQQDCAALLAQLPPGDVPPHAWPKSVAALKPSRVERQPNNIRILLRHNGGKYSVGYDVFANTHLSPSTQGVWVQKTKWKGVWIFKLQY
jgi:hypothetical protein